MPIHYIRGDVTQPVKGLLKLIVHICNDVGGWGAGVSGAIGHRWPEAEKAYRNWYANRNLNPEEHVLLPFELGRVNMVASSEDALIWIFNIIGQHGLRSRPNPNPIDYPAVRRGLQEVRKWCSPDEPERVTVHMPRIGCGLAGGTWEKMEPIICEELSDQGVIVYVYDLEA